MTAPTDLVDRYGAPSPWRRRLLVAGSVVIAVAFLGWLAWSTWFQATPHVQSQLLGYSVRGEHEVTANVDVHLSGDDVRASCKLRAYAEDHTVVGELTFTPSGDGRTEQTIRTEREATSVELIGCTAPGQDRPR